MAKRDISNSEDYLDVRDIIEQVEALEELDPIDEEIDNLKQSDEATELVMLRELLGELQGNGGDHQWKGDWYPVTLIRRSYFVDYCEELVKDIGDLPKNIPTYLEIDWQKTADNLEADYSTVDFDGVEYLYR